MFKTQRIYSLLTAPTMKHISINTNHFFLDPPLSMLAANSVMPGVPISHGKLHRGVAHEEDLPKDSIRGPFIHQLP